MRKKSGVVKKTMLAREALAVSLYTFSFRASSPLHHTVFETKEEKVDRK